jgi:hypothetical protein
MQVEYPAAAASLACQDDHLIHTACEPQTAAFMLRHHLHVVLQVANANAKAIAQTLTYYSQYVCTCCRGNSYAYSAVAADVQVNTGTSAAC